MRKTLLICWLAMPLHGDIIYDTTDDMMNAGPTVVVTQRPGALWGPLYDYRLDSISIPLGHIEGPNDYTLSFRTADPANPDFPGPTVEAWDLTVAPWDGSRTPLVTVSLSVPYELQADNEYFFTVDVVGDTKGAWTYSRHRGDSLLYTTHGDNRVFGKMPAIKLEGEQLTFLRWWEVPEGKVWVMLAVGLVLSCVWVRPMKADLRPRRWP